MWRTSALHTCRLQCRLRTLPEESMFLINRRRLLGVPLAPGAASLAACGGGGDDENNSSHSNVRLLNLMSDVAALDLWADGTRWFACAATDALTEYMDGRRRRHLRPR